MSTQNCCDPRCFEVIDAKCVSYKEQSVESAIDTINSEIDTLRSNVNACACTSASTNTSTVTASTNLGDLTYLAGKSQVVPMTDSFSISTKVTGTSVLISYDLTSAVSNLTGLKLQVYLIGTINGVETVLGGKKSSTVGAFNITTSNCPATIRIEGSSYDPVGTKVISYGKILSCSNAEFTDYLDVESLGQTTITEQKDVNEALTGKMSILETKVNQAVGTTINGQSITTNITDLQVENTILTETVETLTTALADLTQRVTTLEVFH
jgi:hypothetical protein